MHCKILFHWFFERIRNYNLFIPEENDYDDNNDEPKDPTTVLKYQKYKTWLYIFLLMVSLYILFYITLRESESRMATVSNIAPAIFNQLRLKHKDSLLCPCSKATIPHKVFISNTIKFHPLCSSIFVSQQWIEALYLPNASNYEVTDFRTTASSQVNPRLF
ncbi:unnamed protein product [Adineta steineri]|uniref:Uncharacterized protein n=2 Tax=Adineta steineri TaxID=433720 RepID=A0A818YLK6_9BILA|nr:unnamed protein product [Adineta steineri]CAF1356474.1 unnamed protein product [Adineta steineri]CAF3751678.1 unnamed protein product [Adineta steineri]